MLGSTEMHDPFHGLFGLEWVSAINSRFGAADAAFAGEGFDDAFVCAVG
jgi:hypothetical protein